MESLDTIADGLIAHVRERLTGLLTEYDRDDIIDMLYAVSDGVLDLADDVESGEEK